MREGEGREREEGGERERERERERDGGGTKNRTTPLQEQGLERDSAAHPPPRG